MNDITIIYCTANKIPDYFAENVRTALKAAVGTTPIISLSKRPVDLGTNFIDEGPSNITNYYKALLAGCRAATTPFVATCEDDTFYNDEHFRYRPTLDTFAYNFNRWNLYTWSQPPFYSLRQRKIIATMIAPRELFIQAIEEKFKADPEGRRLQWWGEPGRNHYEKQLGVTQQKSETFMTYNPLVVVSHQDSFCYQSNGKSKRASKIRALSIPYWNEASEILKLCQEKP